MKAMPCFISHVFVQDIRLPRTIQRNAKAVDKTSIDKCKKSPSPESAEISFDHSSVQMKTIQKMALNPVRVSSPKVPLSTRQMIRTIIMQTPLHKQQRNGPHSLIFSNLPILDRVVEELREI